MFAVSTRNVAASLVLSLIGKPALAASLIFTPADNLLEYGDVYINQLSDKPMVHLLASGGECFGTIRPDDDPTKPAPAGLQTIAPADFELASGEYFQSPSSA